MSKERANDDERFSARRRDLLTHRRPYRRRPKTRGRVLKGASYQTHVTAPPRKVRSNRRKERDADQTRLSPTCWITSTFFFRQSAMTRRRNELAPLLQRPRREDIGRVKLILPPMRTTCGSPKCCVYEWVPHTFKDEPLLLRLRASMCDVTCVERRSCDGAVVAVLRQDCIQSSAQALYGSGIHAPENGCHIAPGTSSATCPMGVSRGWTVKPCHRVNEFLARLT